MRTTFARSYLFVPGDQPARVAKALASGADAVVMDLEDAVGAERKGFARSSIAKVVSAQGDGALRVVRVQALTTDAWLEDMDAVVGPGLSAVRVPKVTNAAMVCKVARALEEREVRHGLVTGSISIQCTIESASGVLNALAIATAHPRVEALVFGHADFAADIGVSMSASGIESLHARSHVVLCSRAAGIAGPIDGAYTVLDDPPGLEASVQSARELGFTSKSAVHPQQLPIIHRGFTPSQRDRREAHKMLAALESARAQGLAIARTYDGHFIDEAVARRARAVLAQSIEHEDGRSTTA